MSMSPLAEACMMAEKKRHPLKGVPRAARELGDYRFYDAMPWNRPCKLTLHMCDSVRLKILELKNAEWEAKHGHKDQ